MSGEYRDHSFAPTRWTLVLKSRGKTEEARAALSELCSIYYRPVFEFLKRDCGDEDRAREIAHEFFARILEKGGFENVDPERGKFRFYLLGALKHFIYEKRRFENRKKRGGDFLIQSIDEPCVGEEGDIQPQFPENTNPHPEVYFDREWALTVVSRALKIVEEKYAMEGKSQQYEILKHWLMGSHAELNQKSAAEKLGMSETTVKVAIHRLRKKFRDAVKQEIAQTVPKETDIHEELNYLIQVLSNK